MQSLRGLSWQDGIPWATPSGPQKTERFVGKGTAGSGWLVLDHSYQDTGFYAAFRCTGPCDTGVSCSAWRKQQTGSPEPTFR